jgi:hypothetical protein
MIKMEGFFFAFSTKSFQFIFKIHLHKSTKNKIKIWNHEMLFNLQIHSYQSRCFQQKYITSLHSRAISEIIKAWLNINSFILNRQYIFNTLSIKAFKIFRKYVWVTICGYSWEVWKFAIYRNWIRHYGNEIFTGYGVYWHNVQWILPQRN